MIPEVAHTLRGEGFDASEDGTRSRHTARGCISHMQAFGEYEEDGTASTVKARDYKDATDLVAFDCLGTQVENRSDGLAPTLRAMGHDKSHANGGGQLAVAIQGNMIGRSDGAGQQGCGFDESGAAYTLTRTDVHAVAIGWSEELTAHRELAGTLQRGGDGGRHEGVMTPNMAVRRLTPRECERLQGFPDDWTLVPFNGKPATDGHRYKAIGNSMAVPVMHKIGARIKVIDAMLDIRKRVS